ncbi:dihydrofolate reductase [Strongylocentrotus purpuratus]|uniref:dihydrofolate reductase n=1 Tax=Strongylocentrotus purpuratus TaxID=7668 RepID=A0A7M7RBU0_STRPU|nr:dihydrofolate reductase [Strongylocentrotus purpuratus]|eukprot:XP_780421.1 PREDICTED: dihydrofolate reductase [Strongylocentrotus purpuratus]
MAEKKLNLIAAACTSKGKMGIGINGNLPWRLRQEMAYFERLTKTAQMEGMKNAVIMGRKTWDSIPEKFRPLKDRVNVVLSNSLTECPPGADHLCSSLNEAVKLFSSPPLSETVDMVWITGGSAVYKDGIDSPHCHRIYLTRIMKEIECDTFFPEFDLDRFKLVTDPAVDQDTQEEKGIQYKFEIYESSS